MDEPSYWKDLDTSSLKLDRDWSDQTKLALNLMSNLDQMTYSSVLKSGPIFQAVNDCVVNSASALAYKSMPYEFARLKAAYDNNRLGQLIKQKTPSFGIDSLNNGKIVKIKLIIHPKLWDTYAQKRKQIRAELKRRKISEPTKPVRWISSSPPLLDEEIGESWLFHGTSFNVMKLITATGFNPNFATSKKYVGYGALGKGTYFSDCFSKIATYVLCRVCQKFRCSCMGNTAGQKVLRAVFLSRVILGNVLLTKKKDRKYEAKFPAGVHSVYGPTKRIVKESEFGTNEFAVNDGAQTYPEFVVYYETT